MSDPAITSVVYYPHFSALVVRGIGVPPQLVTDMDPWEDNWSTVRGDDGEWLFDLNLWPDEENPRVFRFAYANLVFKPDGTLQTGEDYHSVPVQTCMTRCHYHRA